MEKLLRSFAGSFQNFHKLPRYSEGSFQELLGEVFQSFRKKLSRASERSFVEYLERAFRPRDFIYLFFFLGKVHQSIQRKLPRASEEEKKSLNFWKKHSIWKKHSKVLRRTEWKFQKFRIFQKLPRFSVVQSSTKEWENSDILVIWTKCASFMKKFPTILLRSFQNFRWSFWWFREKLLRSSGGSLRNFWQKLPRTSGRSCPDVLKEAFKSFLEKYRRAIGRNILELLREALWSILKMIFVREFIFFIFIFLQKHIKVSRVYFPELLIFDFFFWKKVLHSIWKKQSKVFRSTERNFH